MSCTDGTGSSVVYFFFVEKLKSNYNQTWFVDATCEPLVRWVGGAWSKFDLELF